MPECDRVLQINTVLPYPGGVQGTAGLEYDRSGVYILA